MADDSSSARSISGRIRARLESGRTDDEEDASRVVSILEVIHKLKEQILEKEEIIGAKTAELVATRDYLRSIFAALADAVLVIDPEGRVESANQAALDLLGYGKAELLGRRATSLWAEADQAAQFEGERLAELFRSGAAQRMDALLRTKRGKSIPVSWISSILKVDDQPAGLVGIARDVRVERRLEEEKLRAVQALAASVAHEIRNPLGAIQNSVGLLRRDLELEGDDQTLMDIVFEETQRISTIVSEFLSFGRPLAPQFEPGDVGALLRDVLLLAEQDERARAERRFLLHVDADLPDITFDRSQVKQVVWNLVSNALDVAREGIAIRARPARGGGVEVLVADDGPGMPPEVLRRACEPFHTTKASGTGLGLAICKRIVAAHGGTLQLESAVGQGTTVSFVLPKTSSEE